MSYKEKVLLAREFRKNLTKSEDIFWQAIRKNQILGYRFRKQHVIKGYIVDFYCPKLKLAIEIDGGIHLSKKKLDKERMLIIEKTGVVFFRISSFLVESDIELAQEKLIKFINKL